MGMRQRLAIAAALLGDPDVLILDEPTNGLDPPGIRWMRDLLRAEAARGRAVLVSSHLLSEVAQSVDDVVVIAGVGCGPAARSTSVLGRRGRAPSPACAPPTPTGWRALLRPAGASRSSATAPGALLVRGAPPERVGAVAAEHRVALTELRPVARSLEDAFLELTEEAA